MTVGKNILKYRAYAGLSQQKLADAIGCHKSDISRYENDKHIPYGTRLILIAEVLKVKPEQLIKGE